ncbi:regulator of G-protein signaling 7 isoform X2 [Planococcus citri]|uniref:regulator of G-protein signaling 7 isoform X2 n=1 Tax=Planococcus citri TaxID=170843 RepID=UPI0031F74E29
MDQSERGHRPLAFDKMEGLVQEMQDPDTGVPVRSQKQFLTSIPSAFTGYDVIEWLMDRLNVDDPVEAVNIANQLCHYGYFFPVSDSKNLVVKDDGSLYRFQIPYYWPCQNRSPDNVEYAIYLAKRSLRNKQRHGLEDYELESLNSLKKNLANKWDFITIQAEEQVRLSKDRKKGEKIVSDSQERAFWRVHRPPPGYSSSLEPLPLRAGGSASTRKRRSSQDIKKEIEFLKNCVDRTRTKVSVALESLLQFSETFAEYDPMITSPHPSNPWVTDDVTFWQLNSSLVEIPTEKRVRRWALSMEELVTDATGLQEFTSYLRKEYSHENIRFWMAANDLRRSSQSQIARKVKQIYDEFLAPGAPCEINIDGKTMEKTQMEMKSPSRFTFDSAAEHVYTLLLKKDCYPRFIRSEHYKNLLASALQPTGKKKFDFFGFAGVQTKTKNPPTNKPSSSCGLQTQQNHPSSSGTTINISKRRGSDRSLSGSTHELSVPNKVIHSHSQSNITDLTSRELNDVLEKTGDEVCPWDFPEPPERHRLQPSPSIAEDPLTGEHAHAPLSASRKNSTLFDSSSSSDVSMSVVAEVTERLKKTCGLHETISRFGRRSSSAANSKQADSTRPSVSSTEDLTTTPFRSFDSNPPGTSDKESAPAEESTPPATTSSRRKSITALIGRKQSTSNITPLISVSSVSEQSEEKPSSSEPSAEQTSKIKESRKASSSKPTASLKKAESMEVKMEKSACTATASTSRDLKTETDKEKSDTAGTPNEVCPWEDENHLSNPT